VLFGDPTISYLLLFTNSRINSILLLTLPTLPCNALVVNVDSNPKGVCFYTCRKNHCAKVPWASPYPPSTPPIQTMAMDAQPATTMHRNKKRPPAPLLQPGLVLPASHQLQKAAKKPWSKKKPTSFVPNLSKNPSRSMDSHVLHNMLSPMLMDKSLEYMQILTSSHHPSTTQVLARDNPLISHGRGH
jgi:hypothetical protein